MAKIVALAKAMIWGITSHWVKLAVLFYCALSIYGLLLPTHLELISDPLHTLLAIKYFKPS